jgi:Carboxypeptidase regulatory-like domain
LVQRLLKIQPMTTTISLVRGSAGLIDTRSAVKLIWPAVALMFVLAGCAPRGPVIGHADSPPNVGGTISGTVRASAAESPLSARKVTAVNIETGQRIETSTASSGGYTMKVPTGRYRLEVELREGEALASAPDEVEISKSDLDASRNFVIGVRVRR